MYKLAIFDWDGTLVDSAPKIVRIMAEAARQQNISPVDDSAVQSIIGLGLPEALLTLYPNLDDVQRDAIRASYSELFSSDAEEPKAFVGIPEMIEQLSDDGIILAVATGKSRRGLNREFGLKSFSKYFQASRCADETASKPNPQMVLELLQWAQVEPSQAIVIGDTSYDLEMAHRAGTKSLGVSYGVHDTATLSTWSTCGVVDDSAAIYQIINPKDTSHA